MHLEALLAEGLMRESALLMQTSRSYAVPDGSESANGTDLVFRSEMGVAPKVYKPQPLVKEVSGTGANSVIGTSSETWRSANRPLGFFV